MESRLQCIHITGLPRNIRGKETAVTSLRSAPPQLRPWPPFHQPLRSTTGANAAGRSLRHPPPRAASRRDRSPPAVRR